MRPMHVKHDTINELTIGEIKMRAMIPPTETRRISVRITANTMRTSVAMKKRTAITTLNFISWK